MNGPINAAGEYAVGVQSVLRKWAGCARISGRLELQRLRGDVRSFIRGGVSRLARAAQNGVVTPGRRSHSPAKKIKTELPGLGARPSCSEMSTPPPSPDAVHSEEFLRSLMRRQLKLSVTCAATFLIALIGMPLLNYFAPDLMATRVAGFTLTWLILGVLFFPFVWIISWRFIRRSIALENDEVNSVKR